MGGPLFIKVTRSHIFWDLSEAGEIALSMI